MRQTCPRRSPILQGLAESYTVLRGDLEVHYDVYDTRSVESPLPDEDQIMDLAKNITGMDVISHVTIATWIKVPPYSHKYYQHVEVISLQVALVSDGLQTFALFHYAESTWGERTPYARNILIGYSDGQGKTETNSNSNKMSAYDMDEIVGKGTGTHAGSGSGNGNDNGNNTDNDNDNGNDTDNDNDKDNGNDDDNDNDDSKDNDVVAGNASAANGYGDEVDDVNTELKK
ncbi:PREDICTED: uncharacterized protein DDB_G0267764-like [Priapulus caudatus]|uniref:Uncharacterized protein DDB_G0267764-like n=1 Tax=Priapulus caudatus TaxID=37621 RepID=A0ABM1DZC3_PRICU|nr:PREDICTED: uncharacterized protein DDB_G0267764-like [Priapulus caudatus]